MERKNERGAAAVEMAILLPVLLLLLLGIMEFGRAFNAQVTLTNAAREGVRVMAITNDEENAIAAAEEAATLLVIRDDNPTFTLTFADPDGTARTVCASERRTTMNISYELETITGIAGPFTMTGRGTMLCGG